MTITAGTKTDFTPDANATSPQTQSVTVASGVEMLVCTVTIVDASSTDGIVSGITWNTTEDFVEGTLTFDGTSDGHVSVWYLLDPSAATANVSVSFGGTVTDFMASVIEVQGTVGTFEEDSTSTPVVANGSPTITMNPVASASINFSAMVDDQPDGTKVNDDGNAVEMYKTDVGTDTVGASYRIKADADAFNFVWTDDDADEDYVIVGMGFKEAARIFFNTVAGAVTFAGARSANTEKKEAGAITFAGADTKKTLKPSAGAITFAGALASVRMFFQTVTGAITFAGARTAKTLKVEGGAITFVGTHVRKTLKAVAGAITFVGVHVRKTLKQEAGAITFAGALVRKTLKALSGAITFVGALSTNFISGSGTTFFNTVTGAITFSGDLIRKTLKQEAGAITFTGALASVRTAFNSIAGAITFSGGLTRKTKKQEAGAITFAGALVKKTKKALAGAISFIGALVQGHLTTGARNTVLTVLGIRDVSFTLVDRSILTVLPARPTTFILPVLEGN